MNSCGEHGGVDRSIPNLWYASSAPPTNQEPPSPHRPHQRSTQKITGWPARHGTFLQLEQEVVMFSRMSPFWCHRMLAWFIVLIFLPIVMTSELLCPRSWVQICQRWMGKSYQSSLQGSNHARVSPSSRERPSVPIMRRNWPERLLVAQ